ncbi:MAG: ABC transporter ATP-binding protein [Pseudomonadota bacterium]
MSALLEVSDLAAAYGPLQALFSVDLSVAQGEAVALMGRNGMGKTTTIRAICRLTPPSGGSVRFAGTDLGRLPAHRVARLGIGLVPEGRRCFPNLTVMENLVATARPGPWDSARVLRLFRRLKARRNQRARVLSGGEQQMLAIGRALMTNPRLLILDEATEGLAPAIRSEIWAALQQLRDDGQSLLIVDKSLAELLPLVNRCVLIEKGRSVWQGLPDDLTAEIRDRYLGI